MSLIGNLVFFVFGGFLIFLGYVLGGIVLCLTIIGNPVRIHVGVYCAVADKFSSAGTSLGL